eukprot:TRINITY_DN4651_c0_g1_i1.p3 TRINITY_DN4651_c0_g1~~TRINITY_DN4651_c0_g1_i1.p3  ORF type:complete len:164 (-),score=12.91 TRINITY_DN4651_c0_g1_i1:120-611(-)
MGGKGSHEVQHSVKYEVPLPATGSAAMPGGIPPVARQQIIGRPAGTPTKVGQPVLSPERAPDTPLALADVEGDTGLDSPIPMTHPAKPNFATNRPVIHDAWTSDSPVAPQPEAKQSSVKHPVQAEKPNAFDAVSDVDTLSTISGGDETSPILVKNDHSHRKML